MFNLRDKVAIVTGSSRGIGRSSAEELAKLGAKVVVSSRKAEACEEVVLGIRSAGGEATAIPCNVAKKEQLEELTQRALDTYGRIDILVCNAATNPYYGPMAGASDDAFDKILNTNVRSNFWLCNLVAPHIAKQGGGSIIMIASIAGVFGQRHIGIYGLSKAADIALARNLSVEWGPKGIRANAIAPGLVKTDMAKILWQNEAVNQAMCRASPLGRLGEPKDIAGVVCFLASDASAFVTGQVLLADGGVSINDPFPA